MLLDHSFHVNNLMDSRRYGESLALTSTAYLLGSLQGEERQLQREHESAEGVPLFKAVAMQPAVLLVPYQILVPCARA